MFKLGVNYICKKTNLKLDITKNNKYKIHLKKFEFQGSRQERLAELEKQYVEFLEDLTIFQIIIGLKIDILLINLWLRIQSHIIK